MVYEALHMFHPGGIILVSLCCVHLRNAASVTLDLPRKNSNSHLPHCLLASGEHIHSA